MIIERIDLNQIDDIKILLKEFQQEIAKIAGYHDFIPDLELNDRKLREFLDMPDYGVFLARSAKGHLLGFSVAFPMSVGIREEKFTILDQIYVRPNFRRRKIGHQLLEQVKYFARSYKCQRLQLTMSAFFSLSSAVAFFSTEKFYQTGGRKYKIALHSL